MNESRSILRGALQPHFKVFFVYPISQSLHDEHDGAAVQRGDSGLQHRADCLDIDSGQAVDGMSVQACSRKTLRRAIEASLYRKTPPRTQVNSRILEKMFGRVDEQLWIQLAADPPA